LITNHKLGWIIPGFSITELLVSLSIIGVLGAVGTSGIDFQAAIGSSQKVVIERNISDLLAAVTTEDLAQSAGIGGYQFCDNPKNLIGCVSGILATTNIGNPYKQNNLYEINYDPAKENVLAVGIAGDIINLGCVEGNIGLEINMARSGPKLLPLYCDKGRMVRHKRMRERQLYFFTQASNSVIAR
tara:strand:+ start:1063 stop:1620 length:558 start_codon:yes stop_codon:yes gene_type:complete